MTAKIVIGILIPFIGTSLGAAMVFFLKNEISDKLKRILTGFAAGVMVAASFWSLLQPALESSEGMGRLAFVPAAIGFLIGIGFLLLLDVITPHMHMNMNNEGEGPKSSLKRTTKLILAVTLHNIPEGMAVGVVYANLVAGSSLVSTAGALALAIGIAIQNFPEGAIVSMPLRGEGMSKGKTFWYGVLSGAVEPVAAVITIFAFSFVTLSVSQYGFWFMLGMLTCSYEPLFKEKISGLFGLIAGIIHRRNLKHIFTVFLNLFSLIIIPAVYICLIAYLSLILYIFVKVIGKLKFLNVFFVKILNIVYLWACHIQRKPYGLA